MDRGMNFDLDILFHSFSLSLSLFLLSFLILPFFFEVRLKASRRHPFADQLVIREVFARYVCVHIYVYI